jgi:hypothetical protein
VIEPAIYSALSALFGGNVFPDTAPQNVTYPFLTYQQVGGRPSNSMNGNTDGQNAWIQFNVWCDRATGGRASASTLMRQAEAILTSSPFYGVSLGQLVAIYDILTETYGARQDISFWTTS